MLETVRGAVRRSSKISICVFERKYYECCYYCLRTSVSEIFYACYWDFKQLEVKKKKKKKERKEKGPVHEAAVHIFNKNIQVGHFINVVAS